MLRHNPMRRCTFLCLSTFLLLAHTLGVADPATTERIEWKKVPIRLELQVGQERLVHFPAVVKLGVPAALQPLLRVQSIDGTVYLLARDAFDATRVMAKEIETGRTYLLDLSAEAEPKPSHPVRIYFPESAHAPTEPEGDTSGGGTRAGYSQPSYVALTRFAAQQLYAPARLLRELPGVTRLPVTREPVALVRGGAIDARPLVAWRAGGLYLTAVRLRNRTNQARTLDPRDLHGAWLTASFQHHRLLPAGDEADTTAVYLISARPFEAAL